MTKSVVLITGATGNLGSRVLVRFLQDPMISFKLLVYARSREEAEASVQKSIEFWGASWADSRSRIEIVLGDITREDLGLERGVREALTKEVTHIIHCAANFKLNLPLIEARKSIVFGTQYLVELGEECRENGQFRRFNYISTEEVGVALTGKVPEDFIPLRPQSGYFNTYEYAKAEAEDFLHTKVTQDSFPVTVYRPAIIVGDSETGKIINAQGFYYLIRDMFLRPSSPFIPVNDLFQVDVIPVDFLANALYLMYDAPETAGHVYNMSAGRNRFLTLRELLKALQDIHFDMTGKRITLKPFISPRPIFLVLSWLSHMTWGALRETLAFQLDFLRFFFVTASFETASLDGFLRERGIQTPALKEYLPVLYQYYYENDLKLASLQK